MFSRVTQLEIDTLRIDIDEAVEMYVREVLPRLQALDAFEGVYVFTTPEGHALVVTFWDTEEAAAATPLYTGLLEEYVTLFRAPPGRESYEVSYADAPVLTA